MEAEAFADTFLAISIGQISPEQPEVFDLMRKACAIVGFECNRRIRERQAG